MHSQMSPAPQPPPPLPASAPSRARRYAPGPRKLLQPRHPGIRGHAGAVPAGQQLALGVVLRRGGSGSGWGCRVVVVGGVGGGRRAVGGGGHKTRAQETTLWEGDLEMEATATPPNLQPPNPRTSSSWSASTSAAMASTMGTARGTTHGSCRPRAMRSTSAPSRDTVRWRREMVDVGLKATRQTMGSPLARPPWTPPDRLVRVRT